MKELTKVDREEISCEQIAAILQPFLRCYAQVRNPDLNNRIKIAVFLPILEENKTKEDAESEEDDYIRTAKDGSTYIDYVKKDKERIKRDPEIKELIRTDFEFPNFNIVFYAEEHIFEFASAEDTVNSD